MLKGHWSLRARPLPATGTPRVPTPGTARQAGFAQCTLRCPCITRYLVVPPDRHALHTARCARNSTVVPRRSYVTRATALGQHGRRETSHAHANAREDITISSKTCTTQTASHRTPAHQRKCNVCVRATRERPRAVRLPRSRRCHRGALGLARRLLAASLPPRLVSSSTSKGLHSPPASMPSSAVISRHWHRCRPPCGCHQPSSVVIGIDVALHVDAMLLEDLALAAHDVILLAQHLLQVDKGA